ncbi:Uncharacterised protein [Candidatus Anstonella stagnisolia]|nr:Uncharacterised protein [Candidatus Anstonella stagnisolia]
MTENSGSVARGVVSTILFGKETSYGTGGTANKDIGLVQTCTINPDSNAEERHGAGQANAVYVKAGLVNVKGSVDCEFQQGRPFEWAWYGGTTNHAQSGVTADWSHTYAFANSLPSLAGEVSHEMGANDIAQSFTGIMFGSSSCSVNVDGILKFRGDFIGKTVTAGTTAAASVVNTGAPLGGFEAAFSLAGSNVPFVQSWELTVNRNSKVIFGAGDRKAAYGASHLTNVSWRATIGLENTTNIQKLLGGTTISATEPASFTNIFSADNGTAFGSGKRGVSFTLTGCQMKDYSVNVQKNDFTLYDVSGFGLLGAGVSYDQVASSSW